MSKPNDNMKKAVIQATLETNTVKNKPDYIKNFIQSNKKLKGKNIIQIVFSKKMIVSCSAPRQEVYQKKYWISLNQIEFSKFQ